MTSARVKEIALACGLHRVGITTADPPEHLDAMRAWLDRGFHGPMDYLARHLPIKESPRNLLPSAQSIIAVAQNYQQPNPHTKGHPRIARYALGRDYHRVLHGRLRALAHRLGQDAPGAEFRACVDSAPLAERELAHRAGLGWFGKNTCLIDSRQGSWFVLGFLLTSLELEPDRPSVGSCGTCRLCVDACPTGCIVNVDGRWMVDARRCISALTIEQKGPFTVEQSDWVGEWTFGCDVCQEVCPFNQPRESQPERARPTAEPGFLDRRSWPPLNELAELSEPEWDRLTRGSPVRRAGWHGLRRNAQANLAKSSKKTHSREPLA